MHGEQERLIELAMKILVVLLAVFAAAAAYGAFENVDHPMSNKLTDYFRNIITDSYTAKKGEVPYFVELLSSHPDFISWCGGSIIGNTWILTAKHCTSEAIYITIYYGSILHNEAIISQNVGRNNFIEHDSGDIALIRTPHVEFSSLINKVELPPFNDRRTYEDHWALICGWGDIEHNAFFENLRCRDIKIMANSVCQRHWGSTDSKLICIPTPGETGDCSADSGGPLVLNNHGYLVGVIAVGAYCLYGKPVAVVRITRYLWWIREITGISY